MFYLLSVGSIVNLLEVLRVDLWVLMDRGKLMIEFRLEALEDASFSSFWVGDK